MLTSNGNVGIPLFAELVIFRDVGFSDPKEKVVIDPT
jgi:hypothetical protein